MRLADDSRYQRLPGSRGSCFHPVQYWLAADHLVLLEVSGFYEKYRRFDLAELVALTVRPTRQRQWIALGIALPMLFFGGIGALVLGLNNGPELRVFGWVFLGLGLAGLVAVLWIWAHGPRYEARLTTSVQTLVLPGLHSAEGIAQFRQALLAARPASDAPGQVAAAPSGAVGDLPSPVT